MRRARRRRAVSLTSLVDVIFLLLLFFMLSTTFTRFAEFDLGAVAAAGGDATTPPVFVQLAPEAVRVNGVAHALEGLPDALGDPADGPAPVLVALRDGVTAQRLTDLLVVLRGVSHAQVTVLGPQ